MALVEWGDVAGGVLGPEWLSVRFEIVDDVHRRITLAADGTSWAARWLQLTAALGVARGSRRPMNLLAIESATDAVGVALARDGAGTAVVLHEGGRAHAELLVPSIEEVCRDCRALGSRPRRGRRRRRARSVHRTAGRGGDREGARAGALDRGGAGLQPRRPGRGRVRTARRGAGRRGGRGGRRAPSGGLRRRLPPRRADRRRGSKGQGSKARGGERRGGDRVARPGVGARRRGAPDRARGARRTVARTLPEGPGVGRRGRRTALPRPVGRRARRRPHARQRVAGPAPGDARPAGRRPVGERCAARAARRGPTGLPARGGRRASTGRSGHRARGSRASARPTVVRHEVLSDQDVPSQGRDGPDRAGRARGARRAARTATRW